MRDIDTKKLRELAEAATPGPWTHDAQLQRTNVRANGMYLAECDCDSIDWSTMLANAAFIAAARSALPQLLDRVEALTRLLAEALEIAEFYVPEPSPCLERGPGHAVPLNESRTVLLNSVALYEARERLAAIRKEGGVE